MLTTISNKLSARDHGRKHKHGGEGILVETFYLKYPHTTSRVKCSQFHHLWPRNTL